MQLYNTLTQRKEEFEPREKDTVKMYVCGPTVYNEIHVGNARAVLVFDLLFRVLKRRFKNVIYVRNITDIDDKIIQQAQKEGKTSKEIAEYWEKSFNENCKKLNTLPPTYTPRATETIKEMQEAIALMLEHGFAYEQDGNVMFKVSALEEYGKLSKQKETQTGARIEKQDFKNADKDFVLWKPSKIAEPYWSSIWGSGRPGWHIECSAMSTKFLGEKFDIHGGGSDLLFPHHENENAQNIALFGSDAGPKFWMHNAMILFEGEKMSKSTGNIIRLSQAFEKYHPIFIRFFILSTYYRHPLQWKEENLQNALARFNRWMFHIQDYLEIQNYDDNEIVPEFINALENDLNTPEAFAIFDMYFQKALKNDDKSLIKKLINCLNFIGCLPNFNKDEAYMKQKLEERLKIRDKARQEKNFDLADKIRNEIEEAGYEIIDSNEGSTLKKNF